jgi:hypothetical protein
MSATAVMLAASAETLVFSGRCFLSIFDANQPQFLYEFPTIGICLKLIKNAFAEIPSSAGAHCGERHLLATDRSPCPGNATVKSCPKEAEILRASRIVPALGFA